MTTKGRMAEPISFLIEYNRNNYLSFLNCQLYMRMFKNPVQHIYGL